LEIFGSARSMQSSRRAVPGVKPYPRDFAVGTGNFFNTVSSRVHRYCDYGG
jgi:hypothetical protein